MTTISAGSAFYKVQAALDTNSIKLLKVWSGWLRVGLASLLVTAPLQLSLRIT